MHSSLAQEGSALAWCPSAHCPSSGVQPPAGLHSEHLHSPAVRGWVLRISLSTGAKVGLTPLLSIDLFFYLPQPQSRQHVLSLS